MSVSYPLSLKICWLANSSSYGTDFIEHAADETHRPDMSISAITKLQLAGCSLRYQFGGCDTSRRGFPGSLHLFIL